MRDFHTTHTNTHVPAGPERDDVEPQVQDAAVGHGRRQHPPPLRSDHEVSVARPHRGRRDTPPRHGQENLMAPRREQRQRQRQRGRGGGGSRSAWGSNQSASLPRIGDTIYHSLKQRMLAHPLLSRRNTIPLGHVFINLPVRSRFGIVCLYAGRGGRKGERALAPPAPRQPIVARSRHTPRVL